MPYKEFDVLIKTEPVYSISLTADTYRNAKGTLGSEDFLFSAVISNTGNIALRDTDRLVVGPANLHHVNEVGEEEFYLDISLAKLDDADTASSDSKTITTDLKIDPSEFTYGFVDLYADIVDKDGNSLGAVNSFAISADTPYSVTVKDKDTEQTLDATAIQRKLVSLPILGEFNEDAARLADDEEKLTIIDATFIQRWLAGLPTNNNIGKPRV